MQLLGRSNFEALNLDVQHRMIDLADEMDRRQYDYTCRNLDQQGELKTKAIEDGAVARRQGLIGLTAVVVLCLLIGGGGTIFLLVNGQYQWGFTLLMAGFGLVGAFLGGAGLPGFLRGITRSFNSGE